MNLGLVMLQDELRNGARELRKFPCPSRSDPFLQGASCFGIKA